MIFYFLLPVAFIIGAAITWLWRKSVIDGKMAPMEKYESLSKD